MTRYAMAIDLKRCFGCQTCAAACKIANNLPKEVVYNTVYTVGGSFTDTAAGEFPNCTLGYLPFQCQHCGNPACVEVCPTGASQKRDDGIVWVDTDMCIGCDSCIHACPYQSERPVRTHVPDDFSYYLDVVVGEADAPQHKANTVEKCTFCHNLIDRGEQPACMQLCPGRARFYGDVDDPDSDVSKAIEGREYELLDEEAGTKPAIYYLQ